MEEMQLILKLNNRVNCELIKETGDEEMVYEPPALKCTHVFKCVSTAMLLHFPSSFYPKLVSNLRIL